MSEWKQQIYRVGTTTGEFDGPPDDPIPHRQKIEPWLSAVFQSEHLSLLLGNGFTKAIAIEAGSTPAEMDVISFGCDLEDKVNAYAEKTAKATGRGKPNIEDQLRAAIQLMLGLNIMGDERASTWETSIGNVLTTFLQSILESEEGIHESISGCHKGRQAYKLLVSFLLSFASRAATRERLQIFTTNYDRLIEYGCDRVGLRIIDRFVGAINPIFRSSRIDVDMHYNPPGIRGEPRYLEGVVRLTKLHGSIDWRFENSELRRYGIPFGASIKHSDMPSTPLKTVMIYPNPAKDVETSEYPYSELFRDFSSSLCRPNSVLVTYGYGFGDDHINRVIDHMLTIPSTHLVIISYDDPSNRIYNFCDKVGRAAQISLLIGSHFAGMKPLVEHYLPKPAIDTITFRETILNERRGKSQDKKRMEEEGVEQEPSEPEEKPF